MGLLVLVAVLGLLDAEAGSGGDSIAELPEELLLFLTSELVKRSIAPTQRKQSVAV